MASYFNISKHDLSILDPVTGNTIGFILDRADGRLAYAEYDGKAFVDLFSTSPTQISTNPEEELVLGSETHHAGFGKEYYDSGDPKRYYESIGMDLSYEGQAMAGWTSVAVTLPTAVLTDEANLDWETWSDSTTPGTWTEDLALVRTGSPHEGTYCASRDSFIVSWEKAASQSVTWDASYQSKVFHLKGWGKSSFDFSGGDQGIKFALWDGKTRSYTGVCGNDGTTWEEATLLSKTLASDADELAIEVWLKTDGSQRVLAFDDMLFQGATNGAPVAMTNHGDDFFVSRGSSVLKLNTSSGVLDLYYTYPATVTDLVSFTKADGTSAMFVALGDSVSCWYDTTESTLSSNKFTRFASVNTTTQTLYGISLTGSARSTVNPFNGGTAWSAVTFFGNPSDNVTAMYEKGGSLLVWKENKPYYLDGSGNPQKDLAVECESAKSSHSGKNSTIWQGEAFAPIGDQALIRIGTANSWIQPSKFINNSVNFSGQVEACAGDEEWLYVTTDNSGKVELLKFRDEVIDGVTRQVWHPIHELTLTGVETMAITTAYKKALYISSTAGGENIYRFLLPTKYGDIINDSNVVFKNNTYFITPWLHGDFKSTDKALIKIEATLGHAWDTNIYFECWMQTLGETSWATDMGDLKGSSSTRKHTLYRTSSTVSTMFRFKFIAKTNAAAKTPILLDYKVTALLHPESKKIIHAKVRVKRDSVGLGGLTSGKMYELQKNCIQNCKDSVSWVTIKEYATDKDGVSYFVKFLPLPQSLKALEVTEKEVGKDGELEFNLLMLVVPLS